ncbi:LacI family DNA-binding transcriptional regulator [Arthrobacter sp. NPDC058127]|uniref:LacI family DNA-binding transcriptional regulator n=1 Tax=Arthrobacter sp. NPDC058127 TaxID=3346351 RepID=UPI0036F02A63
MTQRNARSTIREVAREAGVSVTTVSHALSGKGIVAEATRARVIETARRLRYRPNAVASGLRSNRLGILALVLRPLDTLESFLPEGVDYFLRFAGAASLSALDHGYGLMLLSDPTLPDAPSVSLAADGFIITEPVENDPVIDLLQAEGIPLLTVGKDLVRPDYVAWIEPSTAKITKQVLDHLEENGARRVAIAIGSDRNSWNITTEASYREWCSARGKEPIVVTQKETSGTLGGRAIGEDLLSMTDRPDAVYCLTGRHAAGLMARLAEAGVISPEDILIVAGSDSEQTRNSVPPISAIDLEPEVLARAAVAALVEQLGGVPKNDGQAGTDGRFIVRGSSTR